MKSVINITDLYSNKYGLDSNLMILLERHSYIIFVKCIITSPPEGVARYCFHPVCLCLSVCLSVCLCVCVSVCPANIWVFYFSAIRRDIDLKFIQDTYRVVLNSLKYTN